MLSSLQILVTRKFVTADVVFVDTGRNQHLSHPTDQGGRPSDIVDRSSQLIQILGQHFLVDPPGLAVPSFFERRISVIVAMKRNCGFVFPDSAGLPRRARLRAAG